MMTRTDFAIHTLFLLLWVPLAVLLCLKVALLGNEKASLAKQRGADFNVRRELAFEQEHLRGQLDWVASPPALEAAVKRLQLPLAAQPPVRMAVR